MSEHQKQEFHQRVMMVLEHQQHSRLFEINQQQNKFHVVQQQRQLQKQRIRKQKRFRDNSSTISSSMRPLLLLIRFLDTKCRFAFTSIVVIAIFTIQFGCILGTSTSTAATTATKVIQSRTENYGRSRTFNNMPRIYNHDQRLRQQRQRIAFSITHSPLLSIRLFLPEKSLTKLKSTKTDVYDFYSAVTFQQRQHQHQMMSLTSCLAPLSHSTPSLVRLTRITPGTAETLETTSRKTRQLISLLRYQTSSSPCLSSCYKNDQLYYYEDWHKIHGELLSNYLSKIKFSDNGKKYTQKKSKKNEKEEEDVVTTEDKALPKVFIHTYLQRSFQHQHEHQQQGAVQPTSQSSVILQQKSPFDGPYGVDSDDVTAAVTTLQPRRTLSSSNPTSSSSSFYSTCDQPPSSSKSITLLSSKIIERDKIPPSRNAMIKNRDRNAVANTNEKEEDDDERQHQMCIDLQRQRQEQQIEQNSAAVEEYERRRDEWAAKYTSVDALRRTFGSSPKGWWGDLDASTTRRLYKTLLPRALLALHCSFGSSRSSTISASSTGNIRSGTTAIANAINNNNKNYNRSNSNLEELAPLAFQARLAAKLYARERCVWYWRIASCIYDGIRHFRRYGRFNMHGMSYQQLWEKYASAIVANEIRYNSDGLLAEDDVVALVCYKILEKSCQTNPSIDRLVLSSSSSSSSLATNASNKSSTSDEEEQEVVTEDPALLELDLHRINEQLESDVRRLLGQEQTDDGDEEGKRKLFFSKKQYYSDYDYYIAYKQEENEYEDSLLSKHHAAGEKSIQNQKQNAVVVENTVSLYELEKRIKRIRALRSVARIKRFLQRKRGWYHYPYSIATAGRTTPVTSTSDDDTHYNLS